MFYVNREQVELYRILNKCVFMGFMQQDHKNEILEKAVLTVII
ncbi:MAG: hypothetical protein ACPL7E_00555 [bacterium]